MSKGFQLPTRTARLVFEGDYRGAEVKVRLDVPLGVILEFMDAAQMGDGEEIGASQVSRTVHLYERFAAVALLEWNLTDGADVPIPANAEGIRQVTPSFAALLMKKWAEVVANPPGPLSAPSENGSTSGAPTGVTAGA